MQHLTLKSGTPPGTLVYLGRETKNRVRITLIEYNEHEFIEKEFFDIQECFTEVRNGMVKWINIDGVHDTEILDQIGKMFNIHPLTLEDIANTNQRSKFEDFENYLVTIMKMIFEDSHLKKESDDALVSEQLTIILMNDQTVISFQEADGGDVFDVIRERLRLGKGRVRKCEADYLAYALIDAVIDSYFDVLEKIGDEVEVLEDVLIDNPSPQTLHHLHHIKRQMVYFRKAVWPMRELINNLERSESPLIHENTSVYLRDAHDHAVRIIDTVETYRDLLSGMMDLYMSSVSNRMNEVMKTLTIITTIFVPLTFIAGVYGMNFQAIDPVTNKVEPMNMPELYSPYGYVIVWGVMIALSISLLIYFRRKKWM
ncbi:MAG: magnesium/cobalt transporter CorA [Bacteroidetes bacterium]|jgi:magnesium transporter|nr:magnesium/cobalt transporter CorA [Bacteroidota bacterium]